MAIKRGGLGKGLGALLTQFNQNADQSQKDISDLDIEKIKPNRWQPRQTFDENQLAELAESIKLYGVLQPLMVRSLGDGSYELIAGERRLRASKLAGLEKVPAIIRDFTDAQIREVAIIENVQRENLNPIEEAQAYDRLINEFGCSREFIASKIGCSTARLSMLLRLLKLAPRVQEMIAAGELTVTQASPLLTIEDAEIQTQTAELIISEKLSARKVNAFIEELKSSGVLESLTNGTEIVEEPVEEPIEEPIEAPIDDVTIDERIANEADEMTFFVKQSEADLSRRLNRHVSIKLGRRRNRLEIDFADIDDLLGLMKLFEQPSGTTVKRGAKM